PRHVDRRDIDNIRRRVVNIEKIRRELRWEPDVTVEQGLREREYQAIQAARALAAAASWNEESLLPRQADIYGYLQGLPAETYVIADSQTSGAAGSKTIAANYHRPYQIHGSI